MEGSLRKSKLSVGEEQREKERVRKIFELYDRDGSGDIDSREFQSLSYELGNVLTLRESEDYLKDIDTDGNGTIDFEEFYTWWTSPPTEGGSNKQKELGALKVKLQAQALAIRYEGLRDSIAKKAEEVKAVGEDDLTFKVAINQGDLSEVRSSIRLTHSNDSERAGSIRNGAEAKSTSSIVTLSFTPRDGIGAFELGEVASSVTNLLSLAKEKLKFAQVKSKFAPEGDVPVFSLIFTFNIDEIGDQTLQHVDTIANQLKLSSFSALVELSHKPGDTEKCWINSRIQVQGGVNRNVLKALLGAFVDQIPQLLPLLLLKNAEITINSDSADVLTDSTGRTCGHAWPLKNWSDLKALESELGPILISDEMPPPVSETYDSCVKLLKGVRALQIVNGDHVLDFVMEGMDIFELLPTLERLKQVQSAEGELAEQLKTKEASKRCCTFKKTGRSYMRQTMYACTQCGFDGADKCVCEVCAVRCHAGHTGVNVIGAGAAFCDCPDMGICRALKKDRSSSN